jgi:Phospholipase_D-nuclease N-terminal
MLAYSFPLLSLFWAFLWFFMLASVFFAVIYSFIDNFRRHDHSGWAKAGWALAIIILPLLGTLIYIIARPATVE